MRHVSKLTKSLISAGQLDDAGFISFFGDSSWKITKGSLVVAHGSKCDTLYTLYVSNVKANVICVTEQPSTSLWHRRLGHLNENLVSFWLCSWLQFFLFFYLGTFFIW